LEPNFPTLYTHSGRESTIYLWVPNISPEEEYQAAEDPDTARNESKPEQPSSALD